MVRCTGCALIRDGAGRSGVMWNGVRFCDNIWDGLISFEAVCEGHASSERVWRERPLIVPISALLELRPWIPKYSRWWYNLRVRCTRVLISNRRRQVKASRQMSASLRQTIRAQWPWNMYWLCVIFQCPHDHKLMCWSWVVLGFPHCGAGIKSSHPVYGLINVSLHWFIFGGISQPTDACGSAQIIGLLFTCTASDAAKVR